MRFTRRLLSILIYVGLAFWTAFVVISKLPDAALGHVFPADKPKVQLAQATTPTPSVRDSVPSYPTPSNPVPSNPGRDTPPTRSPNILDQLAPFVIDILRQQPPPTDSGKITPTDSTPTDSRKTRPTYPEDEDCFPIYNRTVPDRRSRKNKQNTTYCRPNDLAIESLPNLTPPGELVKPNEVSRDTKGLEVVRSILRIRLSREAKVQEVKDALVAVGGKIYSSRNNKRNITVLFDSVPGSLQELEQRENILAAQPAVLFTARQIIYPPLSQDDNSNLLPLPLMLQGAVDSNGNPPRPFNPSYPVTLFLGDYFYEIGNRDLNLEVAKKLYTPPEELGGHHGYLVSGLMAAGRNNSKLEGVVGVYPDPKPSVLGVNHRTKDFDTALLYEITTARANPGASSRFVLNLSIGSNGDMLEKDAVSLGAYWLTEIRDRDLEDKVVIAAAAGNSSQGDVRKTSGYTAAALRNDLSQVLKSEPSQPLRNTLVVGALNAQGDGDYTSYSTIGGNANAIVDVDRTVNRTVLLTSGDEYCAKKGGGWPALAPGDRIVCYPKSKDDSGAGGTSAAAPQVAGLAAYIWNQSPNLNAVQIADRIRSSQTRFPVLASDGNFANTGNSPRCSKQKAINATRALGSLENASSNIVAEFERRFTCVKYAQLSGLDRESVNVAIARLVEQLQACVNQNRVQGVDISKLIGVTVNAGYLGNAPTIVIGAGPKSSSESFNSIEARRTYCANQS